MDKIKLDCDIFLNIFVKNSTLEIVSNDEKEFSKILKLNHKYVLPNFIRNYINEKIKLINKSSSKEQNDYIKDEIDCNHFKLFGIEQKNHLTCKGRLGSPHVMFDLSKLVGRFTIDFTTYTLMSNSGFATIKGNCFVYSGKWQYEVLLTSKGVMQLGWASIMCNFTSEKGVGDTTNSYAYDGNRVKKWNINSKDYGEQWQIGDVISVCIDLDNCIVEFFRNGRCLGIAFSNIATGTGIVYFPAISLALKERVIVNFGAREFRYPIEDYKPLELQNQVDIVKANMLIEWLFNLVLQEVYFETNSSSLKNKEDENNFDLRKNLSKDDYNNLDYSNKKSINVSDSQKNSKNTFGPGNDSLYLIATLILEELEGLLTNKFIVESCLLKHLLLYHNKEEIHCLLNIFWTEMEEKNIDFMLNAIILSIVHGYQFSLICDDEIIFSELNSSASFSTFNYTDFKKEINFIHQKQYLLLFLYLVQHNKTRKHLLNNVLFNKNIFQLLEIRPIFDDAILKKFFFPNLNLISLKNYFFSTSYSTKTPNNNQNSEKFWRNVELENSILELESLQNIILDTLIFQDAECRNIFLRNFQKFLFQNECRLFTNPRIGDTFSTPLPVLLAVFHRLSFLIRSQCENVIDCLPLQFFLDTNCCAKNVTRIGGLLNHLQKNHQKEILIYNFEINNNPLLIQIYSLIDNLIKLYSIGVNKQLGKYNGIKEILLEYRQSLINLNDLDNNLNEFENDFVQNDLKFENRRSAFENTKKCLTEEFVVRGRQFAILNNLIFTNSKRQDLIWLMKILLKTFENASNSGCVFSYLPDYYIDTCLNLCYALRFYFGNETYQDIENLVNPNILMISKNQQREYKEVLQLFCSFITMHFCDERIVNNDHKELIAQSMISLITSKECLNILENISIENRLNLIKKLTQPYENRAWTHSNWILLRFWKGTGFAFRNLSSFLFTQNLMNEHNGNSSTINKTDIISNLNNIKPLPSIVFQQLLSDYFNSNPKNAFDFLSSLLNQLNWSFSEFVGMFQEIQNSIIRQKNNQIDFKQLKICCTCFELSNALLRVLEMILHYNASFILINHNKNEKSSQRSNIQEKGFTNVDFHICSNLEEDQYSDANISNYFSIFHELENHDQRLNLIESTFLENSSLKIQNQALNNKQESNSDINEILLKQLCSILNQILNRISMSSKHFQYIQQMSNFSTINDFVILTSVCSILNELIVKNECTRYLTLNLLVNDLSFQLSSYLYLVGGNMLNILNPSSTSNINLLKQNQSISNQTYYDKQSNVEKQLNFINQFSCVENKIFNLFDFVLDITKEELEFIKKLLFYVINMNERNEKIKLMDSYHEEDLCTICYANQKTALFYPCKHQSCKSCITMHLLRNSECFFCKSDVKKINFQDTNQIFYPKKDKKINL